MLSLYYNDLKWMKYISWETKFMLVVVRPAVCGVWGVSGRVLS